MWKSFASLTVVLFSLTLPAQAMLTMKAEICLTEVDADGLTVHVNAVGTLTSDVDVVYGIAQVQFSASAWKNTLCIGSNYELMPGSSGLLSFSFLEANSSLSIKGPRVSAFCYSCYAALAKLEQGGSILAQDEAGPVGGDCSSSGCIAAGAGPESSSKGFPIPTIFCLPE